MQYCSNLSAVTLPYSVTDIPHFAFHSCSKLETVTIPDSVVTIGLSAFENCFSLSEVTIPSSVEHMGEGAFLACQSLTNVTISGSIATIRKSLFADCTSLETITLPKTVTHIESYAFSSCSSLTDVHYVGSKVQWENLSTEVYNSDLTNATIHYDSTENQAPVTSVYGYQILTDGTAKITEYKGSGTILQIPSSIDGYTVTVLGEAVFMQNKNLIFVTIPEGIHTIELFAFRACSSYANEQLTDNEKDHEIFISWSFFVCLNRQVQKQDLSFREVAVPC